MSSRRGGGEKKKMMMIEEIERSIEFTLPTTISVLARAFAGEKGADVGVYHRIRVIRHTFRFLVFFVHGILFRKLRTRGVSHIHVTLASSLGMLQLLVLKYLVV